MPTKRSFRRAADVPAAALRELRPLVKLAINYKGQREVLLRELFFRASKRFTPALATEANGFRFYLSTTDDVLGRHTFMHGGFDEDAMRRVVAELGERTGVAAPLKGRTMLDIGGNIGTTSVYAIRLFDAARTVAFEPVPANVRLLRQNLIANGVSEQVDVFGIALSGSDGEAQLELSDNNSGDHRVRTADPHAGTASAALFREDHRDVVHVPARRLDGLVQAGEVNLADVALVWIDVQGHEAHVLEGAQAVRDARIPVAVEYWPYGLRRAGGLERFHELVAESFETVVDLGPPSSSRLASRPLPARDIQTLEGKYTGAWGAADLLLLP